MKTQGDNGTQKPRSDLRRSKPSHSDFRMLANGAMKNISVCCPNHLIFAIELSSPNKSMHSSSNLKIKENKELTSFLLASDLLLLGPPKS